MKEPILSRRSYGAPFVGLGHFMSRPYLWWKPFFTAFFSWISLFVLFVFVSYLFWPAKGVDPWYQHAWDIFHSFAIASVVVLLVWAFVLPIFLNFALEKMICLVYREQKVSFHLQNWKDSVVSSAYVLFKTVGWRVFWPIISILCIFFLSPLAIVIAQIGIGHIAVIDASDLSLSVLGYPGRDRAKLIAKYRAALFVAGVSSGLLSLLLLSTIIGWIFYLPGVYVGLALYWKRKISLFQGK